MAVKTLSNLCCPLFPIVNIGYGINSLIWRKDLPTRKTGKLGIGFSCLPGSACGTKNRGDGDMS